MGSSNRKRSTKKADFAKPKLKVGKARPKPTNFTDTSFKSRSIAVPTQQSLHTAPPTHTSSLLTHLSHLKSHTPSLRADHLAALASLLSSWSSAPNNPTLPIPPSTLLTTLTPLLLDPSNRVRSTLLTTIPLFPPGDLAAHVPSMLPYIRAAVTSLSPDVRGSGFDMWAWFCGGVGVGSEVGGKRARTAGGEGVVVGGKGRAAVGRAVVGVAGGWVRGLKCLCVVLGWWWGGEQAQQQRLEIGGGNGMGGAKKAGGAEAGGGEWTNMDTAAAAVAGGGGTLRGVGVTVKALGTLAAFLRCGLLPEKGGGTGEEEVRVGRGRALGWPLWNVQAHMLPERSNAFGYLNLFGEKRDEEGEVYEDAEDRRRVFRTLGYEAAILRGLEGMRKEGGEVGRAAGMLMKVLKEVENGAE